MKNLHAQCTIHAFLVPQALKNNETTKELLIGVPYFQLCD